MITPNDVKLIFLTLIEITLLAWIVTRLIGFVPSFMLSIIRKVKNKSIIYTDKNTLDTDLDKGILEKSDFGLKSMLNRWF